MSAFTSDGYVRHGDAFSSYCVFKSCHVVGYIQ